MFFVFKTRSSWLSAVVHNDDKAVDWVSIVQQWWYLLVPSHYNVLLVNS